MFNNPYMQNYNQNFMPQNLSDKIDNQIAQLNQMKEQIKNNPQQPAINQTFQLAPTNDRMMKYVNTIDDVNKETIYFDTPFFSKDMSILWIKNVKGEIKTYELNEIIPKDAKDMQIEYLKARLEELEKEMKHNEPDAIIDEPITKSVESKKSSSVSTISKSEKKSK